MKRLKFQVNIDCEGAAFHFEEDDGVRTFNDAAVADILRDLAKKVEGGSNRIYLMDSNGNSCGHASFQFA